MEARPLSISWSHSPIDPMPALGSASGAMTKE